jgi:hypothetical protein
LQVNVFHALSTDSLRHRAAAAEMLSILAPERKAAAVEIIESSVYRYVKW